MNYFLLAGLMIASLATAAYKIQFFLIYPSQFPSGSRDQVDTPDEFGMPFEDVKLLTPDGENIHMYVIPAAKTDATKTVLFLGPNAGNIGNALPAARIVHDWGYNVVLLSYRGYGKSSGSPSEKGLKIDVDSALKYIHEHPRLHGTKLVIYGRSLGGAVAVYVAANAGTKYPPGLINGVILENTFTSIPKVAPNVIPFASHISGLITQRWESEKLIDKIAPDLPMLFLAGGNDELIRPEMFRELFEKCSSQKKTYNLYPRGMHNDTIVQPGYWDDVSVFLKDV